jgi:SAM-dependent methyltransferase
MDVSYANDRKVKPAHKFRLRSRALVVASAWNKFGGPHAPSVVELGAADGRTLLEIASRFGPGSYTGVEFDPGLVAASRELPRHVRIIEGDVCSLPDHLNSAEMDIVSLLAVLEHLAAPDRALSEAKRLLRPGGLLVATCPNPAWDAVAGRLGMVRDDHHVQRLDLYGLARLIRGCGFQILEARRFMWAPVAFLPYLHLPVSPRLAALVDCIATRFPLLKHLCVNAYVVARKPLDGSTTP